VGGVFDTDEVVVADQDERRAGQLAKLIVGPPRQAPTNVPSFAAKAEKWSGSGATARYDLLPGPKVVLGRHPPDTGRAFGDRNVVMEALGTVGIDARTSRRLRRGCRRQAQR
jgi:hypothetical protein